MIFDNKKSIVLNVRDLTDQEGLSASKVNSKYFHEAINKLTSELLNPIETAHNNIE